MSEKKCDFSIIMDENETSTPSDIWGDIPIKPDRKGPKTIAVMIFIGGLLILFQAYSDFTANGLEDVPDSEVERLLETPNSQSETPITPEQYQQFHDDARDSGGYLIRSIGLFISGGLVLFGPSIVQTAQFWTENSIIRSRYWLCFGIIWQPSNSSRIRRQSWRCVIIDLRDFHLSMRDLHVSLWCIFRFTTD